MPMSVLTKIVQYKYTVCLCVCARTIWVNRPFKKVVNEAKEGSAACQRG